jgi:hypothetical protein
MFSIDFEDFLNNPLSFGFNIVKQIFLFLQYFTFGDLSDVKRTQSFCHFIYREIEDREKKSTGDHAGP